MIWGWLVLVVATLVLGWLTVLYVRHDPLTCSECLRRAYERTDDDRP